jgi:hypothetical protein
MSSRGLHPKDSHTKDFHVSCSGLPQLPRICGCNALDMEDEVESEKPEQDWVERVDEAQLRTDKNYVQPLHEAKIRPKSSTSLAPEKPYPYTRRLCFGRLLCRWESS